MRYIKTKTSKSKTDLLALTRKYKVRYLIGCSLLEINGKNGIFHGKGSFVLYDSLQKTIRFDNQFSNECERILFLSKKTEQSNSFNVVCSNIFTNAIDSAFVLMSMDLPNGKLCIEHWQKQNKATMAFFEQKPNPSLLKILPPDFVLNTSFVEEEQGLLFQNGDTGQMEDFSNEKQIEPTYRAIIDSLLTPTDLLKRRYLQSVFNTNNTRFIAFFMDNIQYQDAAYPISFAEIVLRNRQARPIYRIVQIAGTKVNNEWELTEEIQYDGFAPKSKKAIADIILPLFKDFWTDNLQPNPKFWLQTFPIKTDE